MATVTPMSSLARAGTTTGKSTRGKGLCLSRLGLGGLATSAAWNIEGNQIAARYGTSVSSAGDVNDDGYSDVIVGAPRYDNDVSNEGRIFSLPGLGGGARNLTDLDREKSDQFGPPSSRHLGRHGRECERRWLRRRHRRRSALQ